MAVRRQPESLTAGLQIQYELALYLLLIFTIIYAGAADGGNCKISARCSQSVTDTHPAGFENALPGGASSLGRFAERDHKLLIRSALAQPLVVVMR
jgi:hypothetical protein